MASANARCVDAVLGATRTACRDDLVRVFVMADLPWRIRTVMQRKGVTEDQARKLIREVDKDRASYYRYYTDQVWGDTDCYDLCVNVARVGVEGAVQTIAAYVGAMK